LKKAPRIKQSDLRPFIRAVQHWRAVIGGSDALLTKPTTTTHRVMDGMAVRHVWTQNETKSNFQRSGSPLCPMFQANCAAVWVRWIDSTSAMSLAPLLPVMLTSDQSLQ